MSAMRSWRGTAFLFLLGATRCSAGRVCSTSEVDRTTDEWKVPRGCAGLDLSFSVVGARGAEQLAKLLERRPLRGLNLTWSSIGPDGAAALARGIERCPSLTTLDLSGNWLADSGTLLIMAALGRFGALRRLHLRWNGITADGVGSIASAVAGRLHRLEMLDLGGNWLLHDGVVAMTRALRGHRPPLHR